MEANLKELTRIFLAQRQRLLAFLHLLVRDADAAEELLQEVWLRLAEAVEKGTEIRDVMTWCRGVARNLALHHFRDQRGKRVVTDSRLVELADRAFEEHTDSLWTERRQWLLECIEELPEHSRGLLHLKYVDGLKAHDIARRQGRSADAVLRAISRIRAVLAECVEGRRLLEGDGE